MAGEVWQAPRAPVRGEACALTAGTWRWHLRRARRAWLPLWTAIVVALAAATSAPPLAAAMQHKIGLHELDEGRREPLTRLLRAAEADVLATLRTRLDGALRVDFVGSDAAFRRLVAEAGAGSQWSEPWIAGLALLDQDRILVRIDGPGLLHTSETVRHELAHVAVHALGHGRWLPRWYHEAVAMYVAGEATAQRLLEGMSGGAAGSLATLADLQADFGADRLRAARAYATAAGFLRFAVARSGNAMALADLHQRMYHGLDFEPAWIATFGLGPRQMFVIYAELLESAGSRWAVWLGDTTVWTIVSLLFIAALAVGWRRRPLAAPGDALDLQAIATAGAFAMRTGRVVPPLESLGLAPLLAGSSAGHAPPLERQRAAPTIDEATLEAALDARDEARAARRAERDGDLGAVTMAPSAAEADNAAAAPSGEDDAPPSDTGGGAPGPLPSMAIARSRPPGRLRRRVDMPDDGPL